MEHIRNNYTIFGVNDFYNKIGDDYKNPHIYDIDKCIDTIIKIGYVNFNYVLDLSCGTGEITNILKKYGYDNVIGCDPYLYKVYSKNTGNECLEYSFNDIKKGKLNNFKFDTIICSYALHLAGDDIISDVLYNLSIISNYLIIISPNNRPIVKNNNWILEKSFKVGKSKCRIYIKN